MFRDAINIKMRFSRAVLVRFYVARDCRRAKRYELNNSNKSEEICAQLRAREGSARDSRSPNSLFRSAATIPTNLHLQSHLLTGWEYNESMMRSIRSSWMKESEYGRAFRLDLSRSGEGERPGFTSDPFGPLSFFLFVSFAHSAHRQSLSLSLPGSSFLFG